MSDDDSSDAVYDATLDFFSESFDPLKALLQPNLKPPLIPDTRCDNLAHYRSVYKCDPVTGQPVIPVVVKTESVENKVEETVENELVKTEEYELLETAVSQHSVGLGYMVPSGGSSAQVTYASASTSAGTPRAFETRGGEASTSSAPQQQQSSGGGKRRQQLTDENRGRKWLPHQMPIRGKKKVYQNLLSRMEVMKGPLKRLYDCTVDRIQVKVWTRHSHGLRGYCLGYVTHFDKHWNMSLENVTEQWTRPKKRKIPPFADRLVHYNSNSTRVKLFPEVKIIKEDRKTETCERYVESLVIRGEQIAFIVLINDKNLDNIKVYSD